MQETDRYTTMSGNAFTSPYAVMKLAIACAACKIIKLCSTFCLISFSLWILNSNANEVREHSSGLINRDTIENKNNGIDELANSLSDISRSLNEIATSPIEPGSPEETKTNKIKSPSVAIRKNVPVKTLTAKVKKKPVKNINNKTLSTKELEIVKTETHDEILNTPVSNVLALPVNITNTRNENSSTQQPDQAGIAQIKAYKKRDINGLPIEHQETEQWACVEDTNNGLLWEVKDNNGGLRDKSNSYSWYNPTSEQSEGIVDGGRCKGDIQCDTYAYINALNAQNFCGHADWRLPTLIEIQQLVELEKKNNGATINTDMFPHTESSWYWTASSNESQPEYAWYVLFRNGVKLNDLKERPKHIRLVRSSTPPSQQANNHVETDDNHRS